jgi:hypothetical protein
MKPPIQFEDYVDKNKKASRKIFEEVFLTSIQKCQQESPEIYKSTVENLFGNDLSWDEIVIKSNDDLMKLSMLLKNNIELDKSIIDVDKMASMIQSSRSGFGFCAMTEYECHFCGKKEIWRNTNTPGICIDCAKEMANFLAINYERCLKNKE